MQQKPKLKPQSADDPGRRIMKAALDTGDGDMWFKHEKLMCRVLL